MKKILSFKPTDILIMVKTYPNPSSKYIETCCTAGITADGRPIRLYPIPFRQLSGNIRYKKWQWITAPVAKSDSDSRKESYKIDFSQIHPGEVLDSSNQWSRRIPWIEKLPRYYDLDLLSEDGENGLCSLAYMKVDSLDKFIISKAPKSKYTKEELAKLAGKSRDLFSDHEDLMEIQQVLEKIPYDFYYHFTINGKQQHAKIIDWEICQLFRNCQRDYGEQWESKMRAKYFEQFKNFTLYLIMGNQNRFRKQFMIIGVCAIPKKQSNSDENHLVLF